MHGIGKCCRCMCFGHLKMWVLNAHVAFYLNQHGLCTLPSTLFPMVSEGTSPDFSFGFCLTALKKKKDGKSGRISHVIA